MIGKRLKMVDPRHSLIMLFAATAAAAVTPLPEGSTGIASRHPNDQGIASDSRVIFADDFESGSLSAWNVSWDTRISTASAYTGSFGVEFRIPNSPTIEVSAGIDRPISPGMDVVFLRYYSKYDPNFAVTSGHNGAAVSSSYWVGPSAGPGKAGDGYNKFLADIEPSYLDPKADNSLFLSQLGFPPGTIPTSPGVLNSYVYWPLQNCTQQQKNAGQCYGDHFFANGFVVGTNGPAWNDFTAATTPDFVSHPNVFAPSNTWNCYEIMVKANTAAKDASGNTAWIADGRIAFWLDGKVIADWPDLALRYTPALVMDLVGLSLHGNPNLGPSTYRYVDNVVLASSYIGPIATTVAPNVAPAKPSGLTLR